MAKEIPFEALNTLHVSISIFTLRELVLSFCIPQNPFTEHGSARYIKGTVQTKTPVSTTQTAFDQALQISASGYPKLNILYEYMPVAKINSPPAALLRRPGYNVVILATWEKDTPENQIAVQQHVRNIADILSKSQTTLTEAEKVGYANYGTSAFTMRSLQMVCTDMTYLRYGIRGNGCGYEQSHPRR